MIWWLFKNKIKRGVMEMHLLKWVLAIISSKYDTDQNGIFLHNLCT